MLRSSSGLHDRNSLGRNDCVFNDNSMRIENKIIKDGVVQITTLDERWYGFQENEWEYVPSVTWITSYYPKGRGYEKWLMDKGADESEKIKMEAGDRGTIVHHAVEKLILEGRLKMDDVVKDREGVERQMTPDEYYCVVTFSQWYESVGKPKALAVERTVRSKKYGYAGTLDYIFGMDGKNILLDLKTSKSVFPSHELQVSALKQACVEENLKVDGLGILQVGYTLNKSKHFKFTEIEDQLPLFLATKQIWAKENDGSMPPQKDYPLELNIQQ